MRVKNKRKGFFFDHVTSWPERFRCFVFVSFLLPFIFYLLIHIDKITDSLLEIIGSCFLFFAILTFIWGLTLPNSGEEYWHKKTHIGFTIVVTLLPMVIIAYLYISY